MILGDDEIGGTTPLVQHGATLDGLFRRAGVRHAHGLAMADAPDRARVTDGAPRWLTYGDADRAISGVAAHLRGLGLPTDAMVAIQLGHTVESVIALLGVLRAGMIAIPLPLLWRKQEIVAALSQIGAKAIITASRIGNARAADVAIEAAVELFTIRHVCGFGRDLPDGVVSLDDRFPGGEEFTNAPARPGHAAAHVAVVTFDVTPSGPVAVARNHSQLIAAGLAVSLETGLREDGAILSAVPLGSFAGLALSLVPWLLTGGALHLHHPFAPNAFAAQRKEIGNGMLVLPGPALGALAALGKPARPGGETVAALWRVPERLAGQPAWHGQAALVDVTAFGELGLVAARRTPGAEPALLAHGALSAPRGATNGIPVIETGRTADGMVGLRGAMVPMQAFPPGAEHGYMPHLTPDPDGWLDTGLACRRRLDTNTLTLSAPAAGISSIGGYRFHERALEEVVAGVDAEATIVALPDAVLGQRLAGSARERARVIADLQAAGANPLVSGAFRPRGTADAA